MSKPVEGGMSGISEQLSDLFKGSEPLGAEIARRTTTTDHPGGVGFELLSLECAGEVCRRPIVGWAVTKGSYAGACTIGPIALGLTGSALAVGDAGYAIQCPDGRVLTMDTSSRFYKDCRAWARAVNKAAATQAWDDAGQPQRERHKAMAERRSDDEVPGQTTPPGPASNGLSQRPTVATLVNGICKCMSIAGRSQVSDQLTDV